MNSVLTGRSALQTLRCRLSMVKFSESRVWDKVPEGSPVIFGDTQISLKHSVGQVEGSPCQNPARFVQLF